MSSADVKISVNGETKTLPTGATVQDLIASLALNPQLVAVEINRELVRKATFQDRRLETGDHVEVVEFVGGG